MVNGKCATLPTRPQITLVGAIRLEQLQPPHRAFYIIRHFAHLCLELVRFAQPLTRCVTILIIGAGMLTSERTAAAPKKKNSNCLQTEGIRTLCAAKSHLTHRHSCSNLTTLLAGCHWHSRSPQRSADGHLNLHASYLDAAHWRKHRFLSASPTAAPSCCVRLARTMEKDS